MVLKFGIRHLKMCNDQILLDFLQSMDEFLTCDPLLPVSPLPIARGVEEVQILGRWVFLSKG